MLKGKKTGKTLIVLAAVCAIAVGAFYLWRDLHLSVADVPLPDIVVENIEIERLIEGKTWKLISPRVEHKDGLIFGTSLDVTITDPGGRVTQIYADNGTFTRDSGDLTMINADGLMSENNKEYNLKSGKVDYEASEDKWHFSEGVTLTDGHMTVVGKAGYYDAKNGECRVTDEGTITWSDK